MTEKYNDCDIAFDLLPLFLDGKTGQESNDFLELHLESCESCRKNYEFMKTTVLSFQEPVTEQKNRKGRPQKPRHFFKTFRRKRLIAFCCYAVAVLLVGCYFAWVIIAG